MVYNSNDEYLEMHRVYYRPTQDDYSFDILDGMWYPFLHDRLSLPSSQERSLATAGDEIDGRGTFCASEFLQQYRLLTRHQRDDLLGVSAKSLAIILRRAPVDRRGFVRYSDFLKLVQSYRRRSEKATIAVKLARSLAYVDEFSCSPPALFMVMITLLQSCFFIYLSYHLTTTHDVVIDANGPVPYCSVLIYNPYRRWEIWRYISYMCVHVGILHFVFNMVMQLVVGVSLEMEQDGYLGSLRVVVVYMAGVLAASLGTSLSDPGVFVAGASGGVYALIAAHLATVVLNWQDDSAVRIRKVVFQPLTRIVRLVFIVMLTANDLTVAIYFRFYSSTPNRTGFIGHLCGAMAGLLVGLFFLDNRRVQSWEPVVQWISFIIFAALMLFAIAWNVVGNLLLPGFFLPPDYRPFDDESENCRHYDFF